LVRDKAAKKKITRKNKNKDNRRGEEEKKVVERVIKAGQG
jgi:hypothetical protein